MPAIRQPTFFLSHGGGPWPWLKDEMPYFEKLEKALLQIPSSLPEKPKSLLVISGHWQEDEFTVMSSPNPAMYYDYGGFPKHTYEIKYPAPGSPELAEEIRELLAKQGIDSREDPSRGYDHGTFVPLFVMYPNAEIPIVQLSLKRSLDPLAHIEAGRALRPLRESGVLIIGSGLSFHNLGVMMRNPEAARIPSQEFDGWLQTALLEKNVEIRTEKIIHWLSAPSARISHPREDHLIPLMVALGAAEDESATQVHQEQFMNSIALSSFRFG